MFNIIGAMAEFERELIREGARAGMKNAKAKGFRIGRPRANVDPTTVTPAALTRTHFAHNRPRARRECRNYLSRSFRSLKDVQ